MIRRILVFCMVAMAVAFGARAVENKGAEQLVLKGGTRGLVHFPHHRHQNAIEDCDVCHSVFPQEQGSIERLKAEGRLAGKQVMNKQCIKCHRAKRSAGLTSGPLTCSKCHTKE